MHFCAAGERRFTGIILTALLILLGGTIPAVAGDDHGPLPSDEPAPLSQPFSLKQKNSPNQIHAFWDRTNVLLFSGIAVSRTLDYTSTRNMLARGREEILIPDDVVYSTAGLPALEAAGVFASVGISYLLHRAGHHRFERWFSIGHIVVTDFGATRNYALESRHH